MLYSNKVLPLFEEPCQNIFDIKPCIIGVLELKIGIFTAFKNIHVNYIKSCQELRIDYEVIDIIGDNWIDEVLASNCDAYLCRPPSKFQERKSMYDERLYVITKILKKKIYPSYDELFIYENKKMMYYFMKIKDYPHTETHVFYRKEEFLEYIKNAAFPIVFKTSVGSTSKGIEIIKTKKRAKSIANSIFGRINSKLAKGFTPQTTGKIIPVQARGCHQKHYILVQAYQKIKWEWRIIKIGNSYFGHKKLLVNNFASGSGQTGWDKPPIELLKLVKKISEDNEFHSLAIDFLETKNDKFYINEIQSIFGSTNDSQMYINGESGRYIFQNGEFVFEKGIFNKHSSYMLRVKHLLQLLRNEV
jgi:glutathione synthase/RimK-type ligase-like ATP-grasp enzyme